MACRTVAVLGLSALAHPSYGSMLMQDAAPTFDFSKQYLYQEELYGLEGRPHSAVLQEHTPAATNGVHKMPHYGPQWGLATFSRPVTAPAVSPCEALLSVAEFVLQCGFSSFVTWSAQQPQIGLCDAQPQMLQCARSASGYSSAYGCT